jgi:hypothetical protein
MSTERTEKRMNRFNGESVMLTKEEAIKHDRIFMNELAATLEDKELGYGASKLWDKVRADLKWFYWTSLSDTLAHRLCAGT